jgi:hypothetical protein
MSDNVHDNLSFFISFWKRGVTQSLIHDVAINPYSLLNYITLAVTELNIKVQNRRSGKGFEHTLIFSMNCA